MSEHFWFLQSMAHCLIKTGRCFRSGHVQYAEMSEFGYFMSPKFDDTKLDKLMDQMDLNKDGTVSYYEFLGYFAKVRALQALVYFLKMDKIESNPHLPLTCVSFFNFGPWISFQRKVVTNSSIRHLQSTWSSRREVRSRCKQKGR